MRIARLCGVIIVAIISVSTSLAAATYYLQTSPADDGDAVRSYASGKTSYGWNTDDDYLHLSYNYSTGAARLCFVRFDIAQLAGLDPADITSITFWYHGVQTSSGWIDAYTQPTTSGTPLSSLTSEGGEWMWLSRKTPLAGWNSVDATRYRNLFFPTSGSKCLSFRFTSTQQSEYLIDASENAEFAPYVVINAVPEPGTLPAVLACSAIVAGSLLRRKQASRAST